MKVSKVVMGEVKEVEVGVVNTHLATWYSDTEERWSQVRVSKMLVQRILMPLRSNILGEGSPGRAGARLGSYHCQKS